MGLGASGDWNRGVENAVTEFYIFSIFKVSSTVVNTMKAMDRGSRQMIKERIAVVRARQIEWDGQFHCTKSKFAVKHVLDLNLDPPCFLLQWWEPVEGDWWWRCRWQHWHCGLGSGTWLHSGTSCSTLQHFRPGCGRRNTRCACWHRSKFACGSQHTLCLGYRYTCTSVVDVSYFLHTVTGEGELHAHLLLVLILSHS